MLPISHHQVQRWLESGSDLNQEQRAALQAHLQTCRHCQEYAVWIERLTSELPAALPYHPLSEAQERRNQEAVLKTAAQQQPWQRTRQRLAAGFRQIALAGTAVVLILAFSWLLRSVLPRNPVGSSSPQTEPTASFTPTPTPLPTQPPVRITSQSTPAEIRELIFNPTWETLAFTGYLQQSVPGGDPVFQYVQAWLRRDSGRALVSAQIPGRFDFNLDVAVSTVWASDGSQVLTLDLQTGESMPAGPGDWYFHPLEGAHPALAMALPASLATLSSELQIVEETVFFDRIAVVVDWGGSRLWVDASTGLILRRQMLDEAGQQVEAGLLEVLFNPQLPVWASQVEPVETRRFMALDQQPAATLPEATLPATLPGDFDPQAVTLTLVSPRLEAVEDPQTLQESELYFILRSTGAPFSRSLVRASSDCLASQNYCLGVLLPGTPEMEDMPLSWSPDGSRAAYLDIDQNILYLYQRDSGVWQTLLDPALLSASLAPWSPDSSALLVTLQESGTESNLVTLVRADGSEVRPLAPDLGEMQAPLGWLDTQTALLLWIDEIPKGQEGTPQAPRLYAVNIQDGTRSEIAVPPGANLLKSYPAIAPQGDQLVLEVPVEGGAELAVMDIASGQIWPFGAAGGSPVWSPDGQWVAFTGTFEQRYAVYILRPDGSDLKRVFDWPGMPSVTWAPDSRYLLVQTWSLSDLGSETERSALHLLSLEEGWARRLRLAEVDEIDELVFPSFRNPKSP